MKQQLIVKFIVYMIFTIIFTSFYYVIGAENANNDMHGNFQPFPDILPANLGENEISNDIYAANVHTCTPSSSDTCANGYTCRRPGTHMYKEGHKLNASKSYCLPDNLPDNLYCQTVVGKYEWGSDGGVDSMECKSIYPNLYNASEHDTAIQNKYPCNISESDNSAFSSKNTLMNTESMFIVGTDNVWTLEPPYSIKWDPYYSGSQVPTPIDDMQESALRNFNPYSTVCSWYNFLPPTSTDVSNDILGDDGIHTFAYYATSDTTPEPSSAALLFTQNKPFCDVYDPFSYKCFSYNTSQCIEESNMCSLVTSTNGELYCKPKYSKLVTSASDCDKDSVAIPMTSPSNPTLQHDVFYCGPPTLAPSTNRPSYLKVLTKIRTPTGEKIPRKPLWNCRCLSAPTDNTNGEYCNQFTPTQCVYHDICKVSDPDPDPTTPSEPPQCIRNPEIDVGEDSILYSQSKYTCNTKQCWGGSIDAFSKATAGNSNETFKGKFNDWNPCKKTTSKYDCINQRFIDDAEKIKQCLWDDDENVCRMPFTTPSGLHGMWNDNLMTEYWCDFYGYKWIKCSSDECNEIPEKYRNILQGKTSPLSQPDSATGSPSLWTLIVDQAGLCMNEGYACGCTNPGQMYGSMKSNIDGICYPSSCGFQMKSDPGTGRTWTSAKLNTANPMEPYCICGGDTQTNAENSAIFCNSDLITNEGMCANFQDYDSCSGFTGGWCNYDTSTPTPQCKTLCQMETTKDGCEKHGLDRCVWNPDEKGGGTCTFPQCEQNLGHTTGQYCINDCHPSTCNDSICTVDTLRADQPVSVTCSRATQASSGSTSSLSGECVPEYQDTGFPYGDSSLKPTDAVLSKWVNNPDTNIISSNTFCNSSGLGMSSPIHRSHMSFYASNPYYTNRSPDEDRAWGEKSQQNEIMPSTHKMGCAKGFKPVKWNTQITTTDCDGNMMGRYGIANDQPSYNTACAINQTPLDPSQAMTKSGDDHGKSFGFYGKPMKDGAKTSTQLSDMVMSRYKEFVTGQNQSLLWSGQVKSPPPGAENPGWSTYNNVQSNQKPAASVQTCSAMGDDGSGGSCNDMRGQGGKAWYGQDTTFALTGLYGIPGKGTDDDDFIARNCEMEGETCAPLVRIGSDGVNKWNDPTCPETMHCGEPVS